MVNWHIHGPLVREIHNTEVCAIRFPSTLEQISGADPWGTNGVPPYLQKIFEID
jgi:hypothetical protein